MNYRELRSYKTLFLLILSFFYYSCQTQATIPNGGITNTNVEYYSANLSFRYDRSMIIDYRTCTSNRCLKKFFHKMEESNYTLYLEDLQVKKKELSLNDWFFYNLVQKSVEQIYEGKSEVYHSMATWFFMTKAGYDTHVNTANNKYVFLYVRTNDKVYYAPFIRPSKEVTYVNLTSLYYGMDSRRVLFEVPDFKAAEGGNLFSFSLDQFPDLPAQVTQKELSFVYNKKDYTLDIEVNGLIKSLMTNYPVLEDVEYFKVPFSEVLKKSMLPQLRTLLEGKTDKEKVELLVSVARRSSEYGWDFDLYNRSQPMIGEEVLLHTQSDHEDRCAFFYFLLEELTDLDVIVIYYYDSYHTIGVALEEDAGEALAYDGKNYYICDPTSPNNSQKIGKLPTAFDPAEIEIITHLKR